MYIINFIYIFILLFSLSLFKIHILNELYEIQLKLRKILFKILNT